MKRITSAVAVCLLGIVSPLSAGDAHAAYRVYIVKGKTKDGTCVSQKFVWDESRLSKVQIKSQAARVKGAFPGVSRKYSLGDMKGRKHLPALLSGRVSDYDAISYDPPRSC